MVRKGRSSREASGADDAWTGSTLRIHLFWGLLLGHPGQAVVAISAGRARSLPCSWASRLADWGWDMVDAIGGGRAASPEVLHGSVDGRCLLIVFRPHGQEEDPR